METPKKFVLPPPCFKEIEKPKKSNPCLAVPQGDLLPTGPPMYGPRGTTVPPRFLGNYQRKYDQGRNQRYSRDHTNFKNHEGKQRFQNHYHPRQNVPVPNAQNNVTQQFWCETCDRPFNTLAQLESHKFEHQICGIDDCMFIGHPAVVAKHIEAQHTSGLYNKIKKLSTPEEIAKWREERKKRYPTRANVELRQKAQEERIKRGEKLTEKKSRFGQQSDRRQMGKTAKEEANDKRGFNKPNDKRGFRDKTESNNRNCLQGHKRNKRRKKHPMDNKDQNSEKVFENNGENETNFNGNLKMFQGTLSMSNYHFDKQIKQETNALTSLLNMYGSSSESDVNDDEHVNVLNVKDPEDFVNDKSVSNVVQNSIIQECNNKNIHDVDQKTENIPENLSTTKQNSQIEENIDNDELPDEKPIGRELENEILRTNLLPESSNLNELPPTKRIRPNNREKSKSSKRNSNTLLDYSKLRKRPQNTMLEKLLESDIRHERNVLLQCVRHVVKNNFFGIAQKKL